MSKQMLLPNNRLLNLKMIFKTESHKSNAEKVAHSMQVVSYILYKYLKHGHK